MSARLPNQKLVPISEAASILGVSIDTIRRWDKSNRLHSERPDGKNRYFSLTELEEFKLGQPFSISEVAEKLDISATTLRRLEVRGLIKPKRNSAGERIYDENLLKNFLNSDYFLGKKQINGKIPEPQEEKGDKTEHLEPKRRITEFITGSIVLYMLFITLGLRNIWIFEFNSAAKPLPAETPKVLSAETQAEPEISPEPSPKITVTVKINDGLDYVNIRQKPTVNSAKIGETHDGDTFEFISKAPDWFEIKLASDSAGFISSKYTEEAAK